jgi:uncharacterized protein YndB with AHSA1/START domain
MNGELEQVGGTWRLRFERRLPHPPERVWRSLTEPDRLRSWFPDQVRGEWRRGARLHFVDAGNEAAAFEGEVLACDPPFLLEFTWGTDVLRFEIKPDRDGSILVLFDTFAELGKAARDAAGWHACLDMLENELQGTSPGWTTGERWREVHPAYVESFGEEAASIGPPPGWQG